MTTAEAILPEILPADNKSLSSLCVYRYTFPRPKDNGQELALEKMLTELLPFVLIEDDLHAAGWETYDGSNCPSALLLQAKKIASLKRAFAHTASQIIDHHCKDWNANWDTAKLMHGTVDFKREDELVDDFEYVNVDSVVLKTTPGLKAKAAAWAAKNGLHTNIQPEAQTQKLVASVRYEPYKKKTNWGYNYDPNADNYDKNIHKKIWATYFDDKLRTHVPFTWDFIVMIYVAEWCRLHKPAPPGNEYTIQDSLAEALEVNRDESVMPNMPQWAICAQFGKRPLLKKILLNQPDISKLPPFPEAQFDAADIVGYERDPRRDALCFMYKRDVSLSDVAQLASIAKRDDIFSQYLEDVCKLVSFRRNIYGYEFNEGSFESNFSKEIKDKAALRNLSTYLNRHLSGHSNKLTETLGELSANENIFKEFFSNGDCLKPENRFDTNRRPRDYSENL